MTSLSYAIASAHPLRSLKPVVCIAPLGKLPSLDGQGLSPWLMSVWPSDDAQYDVMPLLHASSVVAGLPAGSSKTSPGLGG